MKRPNIIWIFPDEWRHDAVGYAGNRVVRTPNVDRLASQGATFRRAFCESPICQSSRASLLTCSYPRDHGMSYNWSPPGAPEHMQRLIPRTSFPEATVDNFLHRLKAAGYYTAEVGKMHFYNDFTKLSSPNALMAFGFDEVSEEYDKHELMREDAETEYTSYLDGLGLLANWREHEAEQTTIMFGIDPQRRWALPEALEPEQTLDAHIGGRVCDRIAQLASQDEPFFLWAGFVGPHPPLDGPAQFAELYDPGSIPLGPIGVDGFTDNSYGEYSAFIANYFNVAECTAADFREMAKSYYAKITLIDDQIGQIVQAVERAGIADNTWIVFSSDHGELLGDHQMTTKCVFYDASVRVPAFITPPRGVEVDVVAADQLVQGIDVVATILDIAQAEVSGVGGRSLIGGNAQPARPAVFSQIASFSMVATPEFKLVVETDGAEPQALYDLRADPDEHRDVLCEPASSDVVERLLDVHLRPFLADVAR